MIRLWIQVVCAQFVSTWNVLTLCWWMECTTKVALKLCSRHVSPVSQKTRLCVCAYYMYTEYSATVDPIPANNVWRLPDTRELSGSTSSDSTFLHLADLMANCESYHESCNRPFSN